MQNDILKEDLKSRSASNLLFVSFETSEIYF